MMGGEQVVPSNTRIIHPGARALSPRLQWLFSVGVRRVLRGGGCCLREGDG